jgi:hypothetical protein
LFGFYQCSIGFLVLRFLLVVTRQCSKDFRFLKISRKNLPAVANRAVGEPPTAYPANSNRSERIEHAAVITSMLCHVFAD